jgi:uroporphyrinogen decarboxylase
MRPEQWTVFREAVRGEKAGGTPVALIVDSPWIPGFLGLSHQDYYFDEEVWFEANRRIHEEFPEVIFFPSWWVEFGMAIEPSACGCRIRFHRDQPPSESPVLFRLEDAARLAPVDPETDGLMPLALRRYRKLAPRIRAAGFTLPVVAARGPLCLASFLRGVTEFLTDLAEDAEGAHALLRFTTETVIAWLRAQAGAIGPSAEGILVLDDIPGMLSRAFFLEFAQPYLKEVFGAFPPEWVKVYHNDANIRPFLADLAGCGFDALNWSYKVSPAEARAKTGGGLCLMGNVAPLDPGVRGAPGEVERAGREVVREAGGGRLVLSLGGGVSPGMPGENIRALVEAARG